MTEYETPKYTKACLLACKLGSPQRMLLLSQLSYCSRKPQNVRRDAAVGEVTGSPRVGSRLPPGTPREGALPSVTLGAEHSTFLPLACLRERSQGRAEQRQLHVQESALQRRCKESQSSLALTTIFMQNYFHHPEQSPSTLRAPSSRFPYLL